MWLVTNLLDSADIESEFNPNFITYLLIIITYLKQVALPEFLSLICKMGGCNSHCLRGLF